MGKRKDFDIRKALEVQAEKDGQKLITDGDREFIQRLPDEEDKKKKGGKLKRTRR